jgi:hypothetical protein
LTLQASHRLAYLAVFSHSYCGVNKKAHKR